MLLKKMDLMGFIFYDLVIVYMILEKFINNVYIVYVFYFIILKKFIRINLIFFNNILIYMLNIILFISILF